MNVKNLTMITVLAVSYCLFSNEFFKFAAEIKQEKVSYRSRFACFLLVYLWFLIASYLELPLVLNWFVFLILLGLEVRLVFSFDFLVSYGLALFCVIMGLAVNVFFRSLASAVLRIPLRAFDNSDMATTMKSYPIFLGFMSMVLLLYGLRKIRFPEKLERMLHYKKSLVFYTRTEVIIYLFLMAQLLAYTQTGNDMGIKTWGIKSSLFSAIVLVITIIYSLRVASLHYYMERQHEIRNQLIQEKKDINNLWKLAYTDMLTGCHNRQLLNKRLEEYAGYGSTMTLAFIDINGLKTTNDQFGHMEGDRYLIDVAHILTDCITGLNIDLFRYGGDEFIMMSNTLDDNEVADLLTRANEQLIRIPAPYSRSISFGVVRGDCSDYKKMIDEADEMMYQHKLKYYEGLARA